MDLFYFLCWAASVYVAGSSAKGKGRNPGSWVVLSVMTGLLCFIFSLQGGLSHSFIWFLISILPATVVLLLPAVTKSVAPTDQKACPDCAEMVKAAAVKCRYCGASFG